jgi:hypothetical protein
MSCMGLHAGHRRLHFIIWFRGSLALYVGYRHLHVMHGVVCRPSSTALHYFVPVALYVGYRHLHVVHGAELHVDQ